LKLERNLLSLVLLCSSLSFLSSAGAQDTSTTPSNPVEGIRLALVAGQASLLGTPGDGGTNAFGLGAEVSYKIENSVALTARYFASSHPSASHREISFGGEYLFEPYEEIAFPTLSGGIVLSSNDLKNYPRSGDAVGFYVGAGVDFNILPSLRLGPEVRFSKVFASRANINGQEIDVVADSYTFLARLIYSL
jgi:opacity protein-like surface antigen